MGLSTPNLPAKYLLRMIARPTMPHNETLDTFHRDRVQAITLLERCLEDGTPIYLERWLQARIVGGGEVQALMLDLEEALSHRLLGLRRAQIEHEPFQSARVDMQIRVLIRLRSFVHDWLHGVTLASVWRTWTAAADEQMQ